MTLSELLESLDRAALGAEMHALVRELYPICRSITGDGVRDTLRRLRGHIELKVEEVPSGTEVYDWNVPKEWNIRDAYVKNGAGDRVIVRGQHFLRAGDGVRIADKSAQALRSEANL